MSAPTDFDKFFQEAARLNLRLDLPLEGKPMQHRFIGGPWGGKSNPLPGERVPLMINVPDDQMGGFERGIYKLRLKESAENCPAYQWFPFELPANLPSREDLDL